MGKEPVVPESSSERKKKVGQLIEKALHKMLNPCQAKKDSKSCADQGLNADKFCPNCLETWTSTAAVGGQTAQEALDYIREIKKEREEKEQRIHELCELPCTKETIHGNCAEQNIPVADMCDNCKKFWIEASSEAGQTPEEAIQTAKVFRHFVLSQKGVNFDTAKAN